VRGQETHAQHGRALTRAGSGDPRTTRAGTRAGSGDPRTTRSGTHSCGVRRPTHNTVGHSLVRGQETHAQQTYGQALVWGQETRAQQTYGRALVRGQETHAQQTYGQALVRGQETRAQHGLEPDAGIVRLESLTYLIATGPMCAKSRDFIQ
jgi:hypothetical protein